MNTATAKELINKGLAHYMQRNKELEDEIGRLKVKLAVKNKDREMDCKQAAALVGRSEATIWRWKQRGLKDTNTGKIMWSDLVQFICDQKPTVARKLGFNPEKY